MPDTNECKHENCHCPADAESGYCSTQCKTANDQGLVELKCDCGHRGCNH